MARKTVSSAIIDYVHGERLNAIISLHSSFLLALRFHFSEVWKFLFVVVIVVVVIVVVVIAAAYNSLDAIFCDEKGVSYVASGAATASLLRIPLPWVPVCSSLASLLSLTGCDAKGSSPYICANCAGGMLAARHSIAI